MSDSLWPHRLQHTRLFCPSFTVSWSLLKLMSTESGMSSNYLIFCCLLLLTPTIFPSIKVFSNVSVLHIRWPKYPCLGGGTGKGYGMSTAAATAKSLQSCPTLYDPIDGSPAGSPSLGFSRQEHWSGLPFPSPMHENEKWKWSRSVVSDSSDPMDCSLPGSSIRGIF